MRIQYSEMQKLEISQQNDRARDYTKESIMNFPKSSQPKPLKAFGEQLTKGEFEDLFNKAFRKVQDQMNH